VQSDPSCPLVAGSFLGRKAPTGFLHAARWLVRKADRSNLREQANQFPGLAPPPARQDRGGLPSSRISLSAPWLSAGSSCEGLVLTAHYRRWDEHAVSYDLYCVRRIPGPFGPGRRARAADPVKCVSALVINECAEAKRQTARLHELNEIENIC